MNPYEQYGLDTDKRSTDPPTKPGKCWCLWCNQMLERGFSMCFQNWSICPTCVSEALNQGKPWRWDEDAWCLKCMKHHQRGFQTSPELPSTLHLCEDCLKWAGDALKVSA